MDFETMTDEQIRQYAAGLIEAATGHPASWFNASAALAASGEHVGMLRRARYNAVYFEPMAEISAAAGARLARAQSCFRW